MSNYIKKAAAHARLLKLASAARLIRRQRALQKYAQAVQMQKRALSAGADAAIGAGLGGLLGGGIGYGLGKKDKKLLSALIGAGAGAGIGGLGGYSLGKWLNKPTPVPPAPDLSGIFTPDETLVNIRTSDPLPTANEISKKLESKGIMLHPSMVQMLREQGWSDDKILNTPDVYEQAWNMTGDVTDLVNPSNGPALE